VIAGILCRFDLEGFPVLKRLRMGFLSSIEVETSPIFYAAGMRKPQLTPYHKRLKVTLMKDVGLG